MKTCACGRVCDDVFKFKPEHLVQLAKLVEFMDTTRATMDCWAEMIKYDDNFDSKALGKAMQAVSGAVPSEAVAFAVNALTTAAADFGEVVSGLEKFLASVYAREIELVGKMNKKADQKEIEATCEHIKDSMSSRWQDDTRALFSQIRTASVELLFWDGILDQSDEDYRELLIQSRQYLRLVQRVLGKCENVGKGK